MASDEDYMAFLNKANEDPSAGIAKPAVKPPSKMELKSIDKGQQLPAELKGPISNEEWIYQSDADEAFVGVALHLAGSSLPDEEVFAKMIGHPDQDGGKIEIMDVTEWDPRGLYKDVVEAVRGAAAGGDVRVYKVPLNGTRVEYWVVGVEKKGKRLVGAKVLAVES